jgi:hypothetical protein
MSSKEIEQPFDSIESAHAFMDVLAETILEVMKELNEDHELALQDGEQRRAQALDLALLKLKALNCQVHKSRRMLNDLRMIRRLILNERMTAEHAMAAM